jgi:hypothetical protein
MEVHVDIYASERRIYRRGQLVSTAREASYWPIRAEDFSADNGRHVVTASPRPKHRVAAPQGSRLEPGPGAYRYLVPCFGRESALTAGGLLHVAEQGLYGCSLVAIPGPGTPRQTLPHPSLFGAWKGGPA